MISFTIDALTGELSFSSAPDFESPTDADSNNSYEVVVQATDAAKNTTYQTLKVSITDIAENLSESNSENLINFSRQSVHSFL